MVGQDRDLPAHTLITVDNRNVFGLEIIEIFSIFSGMKGSQLLRYSTKMRSRKILLKVSAFIQYYRDVFHCIIGFAVIAKL